MLYEVLDPQNYALPDVVLDMTHVRLEQAGVDLVSVTGAKGKPPTPWLKCTTMEQRGYKVSVDIVVCGEDAENKAKVLGDAIISRTNAISTAQSSGTTSGITAKDYEVIIIGAEYSLGPLEASSRPRRREVVLRVAARHPNRSVLNILAKEAAPFLTK
ncbi:DUF1446-domain-containing [Fusarium albosuccineum]|uniref:DUF1446-domain-containing n=1 Tax=Fusarium albosuccineum TaxID=1237068 RepID=A0A8H4KXS2_9HYPO|nr:DUF1446-domain-containing [Fusarium albosuccineum]